MGVGLMDALLAELPRPRCTEIRKERGSRTRIHPRLKWLVTAVTSMSREGGAESAVGRLRLSALKRRIARFVRPALLAIDEVGYLSYGTQHADLMFDIVNRRASAERSTLVTTNKPFQEWEEVFPNSAAVVALVDRLVHRSEILEIDAASFRLKEAKEQDARRKAERAMQKGGGESDGE